jgi:type III secretion protein T
MPIKSALGLLVLVLYGTTLFEYAGEQVGALRGVLPLLQGQWR